MAWFIRSCSNGHATESGHDCDPSRGICPCYHDVEAPVTLHCTLYDAHEEVNTIRSMYFILGVFIIPVKWNVRPVLTFYFYTALNKFTVFRHGNNWLPVSFIKDVFLFTVFEIAPNKFLVYFLEIITRKLPTYIRADSSYYFNYKAYVVA